MKCHAGMNTYLKKAEAGAVWTQMKKNIKYTGPQ